MKVKAIIIVAMGIALILFHVIRNRNNPDYLKSVLRMAIPTVIVVLLVAARTSFF